MTDYRTILRLHQQNISQRIIATTLSCSRNTVSDVLKRFEAVGLSWPLPENLTNLELSKKLYPEKGYESSRKLPDFEYIHKEMAKSGVTLSLLWKEYCDVCLIGREIPFMYTQFCKSYREYATITKATMHIHRKPGELLEVDWAGQTAKLIDRETGEFVDVYIFVAALPSSQYAYVEAFHSQNLENWINAHIHAYKFFGGSTRILVPDNLRTGVTHSSWYTPVINKTYHEMAEHYGTAVIPARVKKPKDKPSVEGTVGVISTWILAALRNQKYFSLYELNQDIKDKLEKFNSKPFQKKPGSRLSVFLEEEKPLLIPLPYTDYELATWKVATVQFNYHVAVEKMFYSVPYEYIKHKVDVRLTTKIVEVFFNGLRICSHLRLNGHAGQYQTKEEHMPEDHKSYTAWNSDRFISWAHDVGKYTEIAVRSILSTHKIEQQGYRSCMALLKLSDKYGLERLEQASERALSYTSNPSYKSIQTILKTGQDKLESQPKVNKQSSTEYAFTRGADYYRRNS